MCSTRPLRLQLRNFQESKPKVLSAYRHAKMLAFNWRIQGKLTVTAKPGFIRVVPTKTYGVITSFVDACEISGKRSWVVTVKYRDKAKKSSKEIKSLFFGTPINGEWTEIEVPTGSTFSWKAGG